MSGVGEFGEDNLQEIEKKEGPSGKAEIGHPSCPIFVFSYSFSSSSKLWGGD